MKIGIIGAGISGLVSLKFALEQGHTAVCFERAGQLGGCWSGDGRVGEDEFGNHISSGMYKNLTTNLPKEIMIFEGHSYPSDAPPTSFLPQADILSYIRSYAAKHKLAEHIKFGNEVTAVHPLSDAPNTKWRLTVCDRMQKPHLEHHCEFDALMLAPGHFVYPFIAPIDGAQEFTGRTLHSNDFRDASQFAGMRVLVIGAGPSGGDIAKKVSHHAKVVWQSIKPKSERFVPVYKDVVEKPEVERIDVHGARFVDGTYEHVHAIIYCTGYTYRVPCLTAACGIRIEDNWFKYLYRHCVNIERPSMAIIGLPYGASLFPLVDLQARYYLAYLAGKFQLPSKEDMLKSVMDEHEFRKSKCIPDRAFHGFPDNGRQLCGAMVKESGVKPTPNVIFNIMDSLHASWNDRDLYEIVDDDNFIRTQVTQ